MIHVSARLHAFYNGLFRQKPRQAALETYREVERLFEEHRFTATGSREKLANHIAEVIRRAFKVPIPEPIDDDLASFILRIFNFEEMFVLPPFDWGEKHSVSEYWEVREKLLKQKQLLSGWSETGDLFSLTLCRLLDPIVTAAPKMTREEDAIMVATPLVHVIADIGQVVEAGMISLFDEELIKQNLFDRHRRHLDRNLIAASGGNPEDPKSFTKAPKYPSQSDIKNPAGLVATYLVTTPVHDLFEGEIPFVIPTATRFEHHHIVGGSGHGKTQTLQYMIIEDLRAVAEGERSVIVIDSQGDLIRKISRLKVFAPGEPLHERVVIIDPTDVEWPVSLNLFDIGLSRLDQYSKLDRERLTNSIIELYDFVLGSLLSAEMTQKQNVIFRYVTRLMLQIPNATIHTLRELMEPKSEVKFAFEIEKLSGTAKHFFQTEFGSSEFAQTRKQVLRRLWGILENQTFERMFAHPRSKLDLFSEMNAGKVILINAAKDLLKESGTEIFGRFFIALIVQAAQERATLSERDRMPTLVYIDEAADYFDRNIGIILSQARKYKVGMVLAHQFLGQLEPKLQDAFAANTSIKFAGGVSNKDARALASMMSTTGEFIEAQPKGTFAAYLRGITKSAIPLRFPFGHMEDMAQMTQAEWKELRTLMREKYAVHYSELETVGNKEDKAMETAEEQEVPEAKTTPKGKPKESKQDNDQDDRAKPGW